MMKRRDFLKKGAIGASLSLPLFLQLGCSTMLGRKPASDGGSWNAQAMIHKNNCPHGTWKFFPWHREYLVRFEDIIRTMSGDPAFTLPYWDWSAHPNLPTAFKTGSLALAGHGSRTADMSAAISKIANPSICQQAMALQDFETFIGSDDASGQLEVRPHNGIHMVMGSYGGPMGNFTSPLDPVFWLHHCNVDRLWAQ
ncbi:MAG: tyrosinase family protein [Methylotenera sp.]|nr:tyrosinase family protein [Oligoflexia bacterium]